MMMCKIDKKEIIKITIFFGGIVFGILMICQTLTCGLHLVDDHEYWEYIYLLKNGNSFWEVVYKTVKSDLWWRFRPLYYPIRILQTIILGTNLFVMSILKAIEAVVSCVLIYWIARKMECTKLTSIIVSFFVLVGPQTAIWWKLGPQELTGTWVFALGILGIFWWKESNKKRYNVLAIFCFLFASLYKESFIALIPAVMLIYIFFSMKEKEIAWKNIVEAIRENIVSEIILAIILLGEAYIILFVIGTNNVEYIGVGTDTSLWFYFKMFLNNFRLHLRVGQYGAFVLLILFLIGKDIKNVFCKLKWEFMLACIMVLPQFLLYAKSGLEERYVIPWIYGVAYFFVIVITKKEIFVGKTKKVYNIGLTLLLAINFILVFYEASYFAYRGKGITRMFEITSEISSENTNILAAFRPYDESYDSVYEIMRVEGNENIYKESEGIVSKGSEIISYDEIDIILMYNEKDRHYLYEQGLDLSDFLVTDYNTVSIAVRRGTKEFDLFESKVSK